jgi:outer membrane protein OmpA-like peptidoglycan-associated protein
MRIVLTAIVLMSAFFGVSTVVGQTKEPDAEGCKDHSLVTRMPGFYINWCKSNEFDALTVYDGGQEKSVEGRLTIINYWEGQGAQGKSVLQVSRNYENALKQVGFAVTAREPYLTLRRRAGGAETWVVVQAQQSTHELHIVEVQAMQQEVTADASALRAEIDKSGRVAVYGINFDTGKATLRPDAEKVLGEILKLLTQDASLRLRIEGYTDAVGKPADNLQLSRARAAAVRQWLVGRGVNEGRLTSEGYGQTSPIADNGTESGRAKNRRVELVQL